MKTPHLLFAVAAGSLMMPRNVLADGLQPGSSTSSSMISPTNADLSQYVSSPGGWMHRSCIHQVPDGAVIDGDSGNVLIKDKIIAHYEPCMYPSVRISPAHTLSDAEHALMNRLSQPIGPTTFIGWVEGTKQNVPPALQILAAPWSRVPAEEELDRTPFGLGA